MHYIAIYDENERFLGWIDPKCQLTKDKNQGAQFSSEQTAYDLINELETIHADWYGELEKA